MCTNINVSNIFTSCRIRTTNLTTRSTWFSPEEEPRHPKPQSLQGRPKREKLLKTMVFAIHPPPRTPPECWHAVGRANKQKHKTRNREFAILLKYPVWEEALRSAMLPISPIFFSLLFSCFFRFPWVAASPRAGVFVVFCVFSVQQIFLLYEEGLRILLFLFLFFLLRFLPSLVVVSLYP